ncbi:reticulon-4 isoform X2 [Amia ocellicauda]|uniref:reticulon-4 isoform X2 n=1 Tax=Amia ocellicauda TaxID=2972642 RepID=UPI003464AB5E
MEDAHISSTTARSDEHQEDYEQRDRNQLFEEAAGYLLGENNEAEPRKVPEDDILDLTGGPPMDDFYSRKREDPVPDIWSDSPSSFSLDPSSNKLKEPLKPPFAEPAETKTKAGEVEDKILKPETPKAAPRSPAKEASPPGSSSPYEPIFPSSAPSQPLAQSFAEGFVAMQEQPRSTQPLDEKEGSAVLWTVPPVSSLSPLPSPDSLEDLSLSESPNQAPSLGAPFGSCLPGDPVQTAVQEMPLSEEMKRSECKTETDHPDAKLSLDRDYQNLQAGLDKVDMQATPAVDATFPSLGSDQSLNSQHEMNFDLSPGELVSEQKEARHKEEVSLSPESVLSISGKAATLEFGSQQDLVKSVVCEDSGVASSPDEKLGSSVGSPEEEKILLDQEGLIKGTDHLGESQLETAGSALPQVPQVPEPPSGDATQPFISYATFDPTNNFDTLLTDFQDSGTALDASEKLSALKVSSGETESQAQVSHEMKPAALETSLPKAPSLEFSPIADSSSGFPECVETASESSAAKMSESPTPDLVQDAYDNDSQVPTPTKPKGATPVDLVLMTSDSVQEQSDPSMRLPTSPRVSETSAVPPTTLPDILKSSPLSSGKVDSGSSEGSPDSEQSPILELQREMPDLSVKTEAAKPFVFDLDSRISALMESTENVAPKKAEVEHAFGQTLDMPLGSFDLVKEAQTTTDHKDQMETNEDAMRFSCQDAPTFLDRLQSHSTEPAMNVTSPPSKTMVPEESDSESPMTDSLSPVLEAMAKNPASFQIEIEGKYQKDSDTSSVPVAHDFPQSRAYLEEPEDDAEEAFDQEVSSEEFEIIERPPAELKGVIDEFLETLDNSKFAKASEAGTDDDASPGFGQDESAPEIGELHVSLQQNAYMILTEPASKAPTQKQPAEIEPPVAFSEQLKEDEAPAAVSASAFSHDAPARSTVEEMEKLAPPALKTAEDKPPCDTPHLDVPKDVQLAKLSTEAVVDLLYWRDIKKTGVVFGASLFLLLSLTVCSIVSVCSYMALALLSVTITFRIYKGVLQAVQKSDDGHPFKAYLNSDVALSEDLVHKYSDVALSHLNCGLKELRRLFLVEDLVDSLKFAVLMWILTYVGALFNGLTLLILALIAVFSAPVIYERHQAQIDHYVGLVNNQVKDIVAKVQAKVPGLKRKPE